MRLLTILISLFTAGTAGADTLYSVATGESSVTYHLVHKLHKFDGVSKRVEGKAKTLESGATQVMLRVPVESFDSANSNRDAHMKETVEAARYPMVEIKALVADSAPPAALPATVDRKAKASVSFHGVTKELELPLKLTFGSDGKVRVAAHLELSLDAFKIERPSLMFVKVDDNLQIDADLVLVK